MFGFVDQETLSRLDFRSPATWIATWGGCGLMRPAPGTWGTLGAFPVGIFLMLWGGVPALLAGLLILLPVGYWAALKFEEMIEEHDSSMIVVDEAVGLWIALIPAVLSPLSVLAALILFRFFDILKPWPVSWLDQKISGPASVMADDMMAGVYAALGVIALRYAGFA